MKPTICVKEFTRLEDLRAPWLTLQQTPEISQHLFLRYEWFDAALKWQPNNAKPWFLLISENEHPIGILPLSERQETRYKLPFRILEFIQVPDTQLCDVITEDKHYFTVVNAFLAYLDTKHSWDELKLSHLRITDSKQALFANLCKKTKLRGKLTSASPNPCVHLGKTWADFYSTRSRRLKKGNNLIANKLMRIHDSVEIKWIYGKDTSHDIWTESLQTAIGISSKSWKRSTGLTLDQNGANAFIQQLSKHAIENGWLSIWLLKLNQQTVAMEYQIIYQGIVHALRADYDDDYSELSPGTYMNWKLLEQLFNTNLKRYEMGPGDNAYKQRWAEDHLSLTRLTIHNNNFRGRILRCLELSIKPLLKSFINLCKRSDNASANNNSPD